LHRFLLCAEDTFLCDSLMNFTSDVCGWVNEVANPAPVGERKVVARGRSV